MVVPTMFPTEFHSRERKGEQLPIGRKATLTQKATYPQGAIIIEEQVFKCWRKRFKGTLCPNQTFSISFKKLS
jgi:hypothetical protein